MVACTFSLWAAWAAAKRPPPREAARVEDGALYLGASMYAHTYRTHPRRFFGHHALTWAGGSQSGKAFLRSHVPDREVAAALAGLGIADGGGIPAEAWEALGDADDPRPDLRAGGAPLAVDVRWEGSGGWRALQDLLRDGGRPAALDLRFADNRQWIERYGSGCVVCLASCPGSKIANAGYSMRQNEAGAMAFTPIDGLPADGTVVEVRIRPRE